MPQTITRQDAFFEVNADKNEGCVQFSIEKEGILVHANRTWPHASVNFHLDRQSASALSEWLSERLGEKE